MSAARKRRLADEYDAAQERGEVAWQGRQANVPGGNVSATVADIGLTRPAEPKRYVHDTHPSASELRDLAPLRPRIVAAIERLIAVLDAIDGDPDLEAEPDAEPTEDDEPTLGWPNNVGKGAVTLSTSWRAQFATLDGEYEVSGLG